jgi:hypothetical protein
MKAIVIGFYGCLSDVINCSLTKQERWSVSRRSSADLRVVTTKILQLPMYWEGDAHLDPIWTQGSAVYCWDCKVFCPMSRIRPVTAKPAPQLQISCQNFASLLICVKMFQPLRSFVATAIRVQSVRSQICVDLYIHIFFTK